MKKKTRTFPHFQPTPASPLKSLGDGRYQVSDELKAQIDPLAARQTDITTMLAGFNAIIRLFETPNQAALTAIWSRLLPILGVTNDTHDVSYKDGIVTSIPKAAKDAPKP